MGRARIWRTVKLISGLIGRMGSGKTLSCVRYAYQYWKQGYKIYSNINLKFPYTPYNIQDLINWTSNDYDLQKSIILLDEAHIFLDSRNSANKRNKIISYFLLQTRKKGCHLFYTTQRIHQVEKRLRDNSDNLIFCSTRKFQGELYTQNIILQALEVGVRQKKIVFKSSIYYPLYDTREVVRSL